MKMISLTKVIHDVHAACTNYRNVLRRDTMHRLKFLIVPMISTVLAVTVAGCSEQGPVPTFTVSTTTDGADINPGDGLSDDGDGNCTLRAAIQETNATPGHDIISLPAGTYTITTTGSLDITDDLTIIGAGADTTIIDGENQSRVFRISSDIIVEISNLTIQNGNDTTIGGGGIYNSGTLTLTDAVIKNNTASSAGGIFNDAGILNVDSTIVGGNSASSSGGIRNTGTITITNSTVSDNTSGCAGGDLDNKSGGTATITGCEFTGNDAPHGGGIANDGGDADISDTIISGNRSSSDGGGILNMPGCTLTMTNSIISDNFAIAAGGINNAGNMTMDTCIVSGNTGETHAGGIANGGILNITNSTISDNTAETSGGGAIHNVSATLRITNSMIHGNTAAANGGAISTHLDTTVEIMNCTISGNTALGDAGGGMNIDYSTVTITNSTVSGNTASVVGGGIQIHESTVTITNSTISDNTALEASAINNNQGHVTLKNSIIADNNGPGFGGDPPEPGIYNLTDFEMHIAVVGFTQVDDMKLGALADNGGPTYTHALLSGSPAIDAGSNSFCPDTDQRGVTRPRDGDEDGSAQCDVGAYEY